MPDTDEVKIMGAKTKQPAQLPQEPVKIVGGKHTGHVEIIEQRVKKDD